MLGKFGPWLARCGAATFAWIGFVYVFDVMEINYYSEAYGHRGPSLRREYMSIAMIAFLNAAVFYVGDQITTAIRELKGDESKESDN